MDQSPEKKIKTSERILDVAEKLIGQHGVEAVSLRQIGIAAGSANTVAVQYYFGSKANLIRAIFERRLVAFDRQRASALTAAQAAGLEKDARTLMEVLLRPIAEAKDADGRRTFAAFIQAAGEIRHEFDEFAPVAKFVVHLIYEAMRHVPEPLQRGRMTEASAAFINVIVDWDRRMAEGRQPVLPEAAVIAEAVNMAVGLLMAPCSPETLAAVEKAYGAEARLG